MALSELPALRWHRTTIDGRVAVFGDASDGPPTLFLHGWGLSARSDARALPHLAAAGARVIAPALPGFGRSDALAGEYTFERLAAWIDELLDHLGVDEPAAVIGHSFAARSSCIARPMYCAAESSFPEIAYCASFMTPPSLCPAYRCNYTTIGTLCNNNPKVFSESFPTL